MRRGGFSIIEILIVLVVGAVLIGLALPAFEGLSARRNVRNARDAFVWLASRARAEAVQRGENVRLRVDPAAGLAAMLDAAGDTLEVLDFSDDYEANVSTTGGSQVTICYTPRGFAASSCPASEETVTFTLGEHSEAALVRVLGAVDRL